MLRRASRRVLIGVVGVIVLACLQAGAGFAQGVSSYSEPTGTLSVGVGAQATGTVNCPSGDVALDGGYYQPLTDIYITQSAPSDASGAGWSVSVNNLTGEAVSVTMYAVCAQSPGSYSVQTTTCEGTASCTITCPLGTSVTGGGYSYSGSITANGSYPSASNQWSLAYTFFSGSINDEAVCARAPDGYVRESGVSGQYPGLVNVPCPSGAVVIGGGGSEGSFSQNAGWSAPIAFGPTLESTQWSFGSGYMGAPTPVSGWAICAQEQPPAPTVSGVSPASGPVAGGTSVVITGTNLTGATAVTFGTAGPAAGFTVNSATQITAIAPADSAATVDITVTTPGGTSATSAADRFTYLPAPTVTTISPASGTTAGGSTVTITGTNLTGATAVNFGAIAGSNVTVVNATTVTATSPAGSAGMADVTVTTPGGTSATSAADHYTYVTPAPTVTAVNPSSGTTAGGTSVTITGTNLTGATAVHFGAIAGSNVTVVNATTVTATLPAGSAGTIDVTVTTPGGTSAPSANDHFTYVSTAPAPPGVAPGPPTVQSATGAAFSGSVNPNGLATTAFFEYGIDLNDRGPGSSTVLYDQTTPVQQVGSDSGNHAISAPVTELVPNAVYHVRLVATNGAGTTNGPDQTFTTPASAPPPPPVLGKAVDVTPVSGLVFIKPPPGKTVAGDPTAAAAQLGKGQGFVPLTEARQIPTGSQIDALQGSLKLVTATGNVGKTQNGTFGGAIFTLSQDRTGITKGLTNLALQESAFRGAPTYATCKPNGKGKKAADQATTASLSSRTLQLLKANAHGKFKTTGRYSSATVRGTIWTIADRCDGTLTHAIRDTVLIQDFVRHRTILLHAGNTYLARAVRTQK